MEKRQVLDEKNRLRLFKARKHCRITQAELADRCGVTAMMINQCEIGKKQPSIDLLDRWARVLGLELSITVRRPPSLS